VRGGPRRSKRAMGVPGVSFGRKSKENRAENLQPDCLQAPRKIENGRETALELVSGACLGCDLHHFSGPTRFKGSRGQVRPGIRQKPRMKILIFTPLGVFKNPPGVFENPPRGPLKTPPGSLKTPPGSLKTPPGVL